MDSVAALPEEGPKITGGKPRYQIGDTVRVNCTSGRSKPAAQLSWYINGDPVSIITSSSHNTRCATGQANLWMTFARPIQIWLMMDRCRDLIVVKFWQMLVVVFVAFVGKLLMMSLVLSSIVDGICLLMWFVCKYVVAVLILYIQSVCVVDDNNVPLICGTCAVL